MNNGDMPHGSEEYESSHESEERLEACQEAQMGCSTLSGEISHNDPRAKLDYLMATAGRECHEEERHILLGNEDILAMLKRDFPLPQKRKEALFSLVTKCLDSQTSESVPPEMSAVEIKNELEASQQQIALKTEKREASQNSAKNRHENVATLQKENSELKEENADLEALIDNIFRTKIKAGNLEDSRTAMTAYLEAEYGSEPATFERLQLLATQDFDDHAVTLQAMEGVFTKAEVDTLFAGSMASSVMLDFSSDEPITMYADVFSRIDQSSLSTERKAELKKGALNVIKHTQQDINTGSKVQDAATTMVIDSETGASVPLYTENKNEAEVIEGVTTFTNDGSEVFLKAQVGCHTIKKDVTGWSSQSVGAYAEALGMWVATESFGATGFMESIYKIDFSFLEDNAFDPFKMIEMRQKISYMVGGYEGYDGDIFDPQAKKGLIQAQMRALSGSNTAYGWENDQASTTKMVDQLGLDNLIVLKEFGSYSQAKYLSGDISYADVHQHLYGRFPALVEEPKA